MADVPSFRRWLSILVILAIASYPGSAVADIVELTPGLRIGGLYDDNIDFINDDEGDKIEDYGLDVTPELSLGFLTELLTVEAIGEVQVIRYLEESDYDTENQRYRFNLDYLPAQRWEWVAGYEYIADETIDSQFQETGRVLEREDLRTHKAVGGVFYDATELTNIGLNLRYRDTSYIDDDPLTVDFERYTAELPIGTEFKTQTDTLIVTPEYSRWEFANEDVADDFRLNFAWNHASSPTFSSELSIGGRYTEREEADGDRNSNWGGVGRLTLNKTGETFTGTLQLSHDLRSAPDAELRNITRLYLFVDQSITEQFGFLFSGSAFYNTREGDDVNEDQVFSFEVLPALYYDLTADHRLSLEYRYRFQQEFDEPEDPISQQNVVALYLSLKFPQQWEL